MEIASIWIEIRIPREFSGFNEVISCKVCVKPDMEVGNVIVDLLRCLDLGEFYSENLLLISDNTKLDLQKSFSKNSVTDECILQIISSNDRMDLGESTDDDDIEPGETIQVYCTTRVLDGDFKQYTPIKVYVNLFDTCQKMMEDVKSIWDSKEGLKFKFGRVVLSPLKTFDEIGISNGSEIIVTGGRC